MIILPFNKIDIAYFSALQNQTDIKYQWPVFTGYRLVPIKPATALINF